MNNIFGQRQYDRHAFDQFQDQHYAAITLTKQDLKEKISKLQNLQKFKSLLDENFSKKLSDSGKNIIASGLNQEALNITEEEIKKELREHYNAALGVGESALKQGADPKKATLQAESRFQQYLEKSKEKLFQAFISELAKKQQIFCEEDKTALRDVFFQYLDDTIHKYNESLKDFEALESVKARLQLHNESLKDDSKASMTAKELDKNKLDTGPKAQTVPGYGVGIDNLRKQLKHALASLKPGERINIEVTKPQRDELEKNITEAGLQYRAPLLAMLLLLYLHIIHFTSIPSVRINKDNDEQRVLKALKDLAKKDGLFIDPKDINLKINVVGKDGKKQVILQGPLAEPLASDLSLEIAKLRSNIFSNNKPLNGPGAFKPTQPKVKKEEEQEEKFYKTPRPKFYGL